LSDPDPKFSSDEEEEEGFDNFMDWEKEIEQSLISLDRDNNTSTRQKRQSLRERLQLSSTRQQELSNEHLQDEEKEHQEFLAEMLGDQFKESNAPKSRQETIVTRTISILKTFFCNDTTQFYTMN
jgi:hypothetical protein